MIKEETKTGSPWLTFQEAADRLKLTKRTLQNYASRGRIQAYRSEMGTKRFRIEDVDNFLKPIPFRGI